MPAYPDTLRAISIINPFGWLICKGYKPYEYRSWDTSFRGQCLIHVSASTACESDFEADIAAGELTKADVKAMRKAIIGFAEMTGTVWDAEHEQWAHRMEQPALFNQPIPCPGALNYWTPYKNKPAQAQAFQQAWDVIQSGEYTAAHPDTYAACFLNWGLEPLTALKYPLEDLEDLEEEPSEPRVLITPPPKS